MPRPMPDDELPPLRIRRLEKKMDELARQIGQLARDDPKRAALMEELHQLAAGVRKLKGKKT